MSIRHMVAVFDAMPELDKSETLVLLAMADRANDETGYFWSSGTNLAARARMTRRGFLKVAARLESMGYIERLPERGRANTWRLLFDLNGEIRPARELYPQRVNRVHRGVNRVHRGGERRSQGCEPRSQGGVNRVHPEPIYEPSINQRNAHTRVKKKSTGPRPPAIEGMLARIRARKGDAAEQEAGSSPSDAHQAAPDRAGATIEPGQGVARGSGLNGAHRALQTDFGLGETEHGGGGEGTALDNAQAAPDRADGAIGDEQG